MAKAWEIRVRGLVQGVGFRPFVWQIANRAGHKGEVLNDASGVLIRLAANVEEIDAFITVLRETPPPLSRIDRIEKSALKFSAGWPDFQIRESEAGEITTGIVPDTATCDDCLAEILDPGDRRYNYSFTNCTNCGPRLSIIQAIPYDRDKTAMAGFKMCALCQKEYDNPANRRFHAQPNACPTCGPHLWVSDAEGKIVEGDPLRVTANLLKQDHIVAIKGIGGFQLACDARSEEAILKLRRRKNRYAKPLALMGRNLEMVERFVHLNSSAKETLLSPQAPIVLAPKDGTALPGQIAPMQKNLGFMLPNSPLHHLLMRLVNSPIVLTSGNLSEEPQVIDNELTLEKLGGIADYWLMHDRDIVNRLDDSVVQIIGKNPQSLRRARGYAPTSLQLHESFASAPAVLAMGADLKNTFCLLSAGQAIVSQHIGHLASPETHADFRKNIALYHDIHDFSPEIVAVDMHPGYFSTRFGQETAANQGYRTHAVQHHHAHIAAVLGEHGFGIMTPPVLGITLDGLGYGTDDTLWGGEFMLADFHTFERVGHFLPVALPGADKANLQPWRNTLAHLLAAFGPMALDIIERKYGSSRLLSNLREKPVEILTQIIATGNNSPLSSSAGRLFDAVAAALGLCFDAIRFEGQAAMQLQAMAETCTSQAGCYEVLPEPVITWRPLWEGILNDLQKGVANEVIAARFHNTIISVVSDLGYRIASSRDVETIVLSGGVFQNALIADGIEKQLAKRQLKVLMPVHFPANDGGISLGQALVAAASNHS